MENEIFKLFGDNIRSFGEYIRQYTPVNPLFCELIPYINNWIYNSPFQIIPMTAITLNKLLDKQYPKDLDNNNSSSYIYKNINHNYIINIIIQSTVSLEYHFLYQLIIFIYLFKNNIQLKSNHSSQNELLIRLCELLPLFNLNEFIFKMNLDILTIMELGLVINNHIFHNCASIYDGISENQDTKKIYSIEQNIIARFNEFANRELDNLIITNNELITMSNNESSKYLIFLQEHIEKFKINYNNYLVNLIDNMVN